MKKRVLFLVPGIWSMGRKKGLSTIFRLLTEAQEVFDCTVITSEPHILDEDFPKIEIKKVYVPFLRTRIRLVDLVIVRMENLLLNMRYFFVAVREVQRPDLIYCSSSIPVFATFLLRYFWKVKTIHRIYGTFLFPFLGKKWEFLKKYEEVALFKLPADLYVITNDGTNGDKVAEYFGVSANKVWHVRNGVEVVPFDDTKHQRKATVLKDFDITEDAKVFISVSRLVSWKRVDRVIESFIEAAPKKSCLLIVGDGPERERLEELATLSNIIFVGAVSNERVKELLFCSDVFVSLFDFSNIGNTLLEALSYGLPIISWDVGDTSSVVNSNNGVLIKAVNEKELISSVAVAIGNLAEDDSLRRNLAEGSYEFSRDNLRTWDERILEEINIISKIASEKVDS